MSEPDLSAWPTKAAAAAALQCSVRSLELRIQGGEIEVRPRRRPGQRRELVCNPRDIESLKPPAFVLPASSELKRANANGLAVPTTQRGDQPPSSGNAPQALDALAAWLSTTAAAQQPQNAPEEPKPWLTLDAAAQLSGLSQAFLKRECRAGNIRAVRDQRKWMIHRPSLLAFDGTTGTIPAKKS